MSERYNHATVTELSAPGVGGTYANGVASPTGLAFDGQGNLFVGNSLSGTITEIAPGGLSNSVFASGFNRPEGLAFDRNGILYVANYGSGVVSQVSPAGVVSPFANLGAQIGGLATSTHPGTCSSRVPFPAMRSSRLRPRVRSARSPAAGASPSPSVSACS